MHTLRRSVVWLTVSRAGILAVVVVLTLLLGRNSQFVQPVGVLAFLVFALSLVYGLALQLGLSPAVLVPIQLCNDILLVTWLVYRTGDVESPFNALYLVVVFSANFYSPQRAFPFTLAAVLLAVAVGVGTVSGFIPRADGSTYAAASIPDLQLNLSYTVVATVSVAILSTYLATRQQISDTALEAASRRLADLRAFNERIIESMRSGLITAGLDGLVTSCNRAAEEIVGCSEERLVGRPLHELFGKATLGYFDSLREPDAETVLRSDVELTRPDGASVRVGFNVAPLTSESAEVRGVVVIFQDLTEVYELEQEVRRREKLAALGSMAAGLAHEIRNPLASIRGSAQVLASELAVDAASRRMLDIIQRESERLNRTLTEFLAFARPAPFSPVEFDLKRAISEAVALLKNSPEVGPDHEIVESYPDAPCTIVGDPNQVRQIFWNLARNGLQAMPKGGRLTVRVEPAAGGYRLEVADEGVGISREQLDHLFEPFASQKPGGTGLGMAIVYQFVQDHGGRIGVESEVGTGTRVSVDLKTRPEPTSLARGEAPVRDAGLSDARRGRA